MALASVSIVSSNPPPSYDAAMPEPFDALFTAADLAPALVAINLVAFAMFGVDKAKAEAGKRRIAESTLLLLAFVGGTPGAYAGRAAEGLLARLVPKRRALHTVATLQAMAMGLALGWSVAA